jgi:dipeptidyl-peptidase-4
MQSLFNNFYHPISGTLSQNSGVIMRNKFLFFLFVFLYSFTFSQQKQNVTIEWIYSDESKSITNLPNVFWLKNNSAVIYNSKKENQQNNFELLNPETGQTKILFDVNKSLESLKTILGDKAPKVLKMLDAIDINGKSGAFIFDGDIFSLDFSSSQIQRITNTIDEEKNISFSPDGNNLAFVRSNNLFVYNLISKLEKQITSDGSQSILNGTLSWVYWEEIFGRKDIGYWWSPDSKSIAFLRSDESKVSEMYFPDFKPIVPDVIKQKYPKTGGTNPTVEVGIADIQNQKITWADFSNYPYEYIIRVNWLPDSEQVAVQTMNRMQDELNLFFIDKNLGTPKHILKETDPGWVNVNDDLTFIKNGSEFLWVSERSGYAHIYRYDKKGKLINQVTKGEWAVASSGGSAFWVRGAISAVDEKNEIVFFTAQEKDPKEKHLYKINFNGTGFRKLSTGNFTHSINFSHEAKYYFDTYSNISTPPVLSLYKNDGTFVKQIKKYDEQKLASLDLQRPEIFSITARDGFLLPAEIMKPKNFDAAKKYPLIVYVYGGPSAAQVQNTWRNSIYFDQVLLDNGFIVAIIDPRSSTAISKKLENIVLKNMAGQIELDDLVDGIQWFKKQSYIDSSRVGVWGWSGGGTFTLNAMTHSKEFKAGIAVAGVTDWRYYDSKFGEMAMKTPQVNPDGYEKTSLVKSAKDLHGRLMIVFGSYDDNVHPQNSYAFIDELIKVNKMFDMMVYPMRKHGISDAPARIHLYNKMLEFWKNNL